MVDELVALLDTEGQVVGQAPRSVVRRDNLRHGATAVLVRNSQQQIYVHLRSGLKDWAPSHHDAAAGGILRPGEDPAESALRELAEELGVEGVSLRPLGLSSYDDDTTKVVEHVFETTWDGHIAFNDGEVQSGEWLGLGELADRLADAHWLFVPDTRALLEGLAARGLADYSQLRRG
jgi:isopentenyldiphosphate isomerase